MAKPKDKYPWFKFYPSNWRTAKLRLCSIGARGLWMEMLCIMHEAEPYGHLLNNGIAVSNKQLAQIAGIGLTEVMKLICELEVAGVYSRTEDKVIYSRKMVRDKEKAEKDRNNGKGGGNPILIGEDKGGVNPPDKAQKPKLHSNSKATAAAEAVVLDEGQEKQALTLRVMLAAIRSGKKWSVPDMSFVEVWLAAGIAPNTITTACTPLLNRKEDMASLAYCDSAVRSAHEAAPHLQIVGGKKVFVIHGTQAWGCWQQVSPGGRGWPVRQRENDRGVLQDGWDFDSEYPPGYDEATGERIAPSSDQEENAA